VSSVSRFKGVRVATAFAIAAACASAAAAPQRGTAAAEAQAEMPMGLAQVAAVQSLHLCVAQASQYHRVNATVLAAILRHESRLRPDVVRRNADGSFDAGIAQMNSVHWPDLARHGIAPEALLNPCVGTFVAAWHLSKQFYRWGYTWWAVGAYHSGTPAANERYQVRIWNELVAMGAVPGPKLSVP
jgi:soluble lytic murein transglycosylase-like protein